MMAEDRREWFIGKAKAHVQGDDSCLVWVIGKDKKVFSSLIKFDDLGLNAVIGKGPHSGLEWFPWDYNHGR